MKKAKAKKAAAKKTTRRTGTKVAASPAARKSTSKGAKTRSSVAGGDKPNQPWLTILVDSVDPGESGGSDMAFTASLWDNSVGFGVDTGKERHRILYDALTSRRRIPFPSPQRSAIRVQTTNSPMGRSTWRLI